MSETAQIFHFPARVAIGAVRRQHQQRGGHFAREIGAAMGYTVTAGAQLISAAQSDGGCDAFLAAAQQDAEALLFHLITLRGCKNEDRPMRQLLLDRENGRA
ncbi:hypothetical protein AAIH46_18065 [Rhizobium sp. 0TCS1.26]|uniref:hypothetical protein n=1 Tax=Rhizobium sp. 0TCS1.26 TaxID=3142623 RepID=UPI003D29D694